MICKKNVRSLFVSGIVTMLLLAIVSSSGFAAENSKDLEGSWRVTIGGGPGTPELPTWYEAFVTFTGNGGLVATIADPSIKTGHGAWTRKPKQVFPVTILLYQFGPTGSFVGTLKARATLRVNDKSDSFDSDDYHFEFFDKDGHPTGFSGTGSAHGTRIKVEPADG